MPLEVGTLRPFFDGLGRSYAIELPSSASTVSFLVAFALFLPGATYLSSILIGGRVISKSKVLGSFIVRFGLLVIIASY